MSKQWLAPLAQICSIILIVSIVGVAGSAYYVTQQPAQRAETMATNFLRGQQMPKNASKFVTEPLSWAVVGFSLIGVAAGVTWDWARREQKRMRRALERMGVFPPPTKGFLSRILGRG